MCVLQTQRDKVRSDLKAVLGFSTTLALGRLYGSIVKQHMNRILLLFVLLCEVPNGSAGSLYMLWL